MNKQATIMSLLLLSVTTLMAQIKLPALISNNMVLQQQSSVALWGWATPGEQVQITTSWNNKKVHTTANAEGKWITTVKTTKAGGPYTITFEGSNQLVVNDVLLGEVWLASGQSNMEFVVKKAEGWKTGIPNYEQVIPNANNPTIRMIDVPNIAADSLQTDFIGQWVVCTPQTVGDFSAVAYFFSKEIQNATGYPIGIINSTWGGTPAESWTKKSILENEANFQPILERYQKSVEEFPTANEKWKVEYQKWKDDTSSAKKGAPAQPIGPRSGKSPYKLYNGMIAPLIPYTLKGVIWYQGESNAGRGYQYRQLFPAMIDSWRKDWNNKKLPFYFVQISPHYSQNPDIREAQLVTFRNVPYTGIVVTTDNGDSLDIHPRNKELVGKRLSLWALNNEYGKKATVSGPLYKSMKTAGNTIIIHFDYANGLKAADGSLKEFTIAGKDQQFKPANARIEGNTVVVWSDAVQHPVAVRFAWRNVPTPDLYNEANLPASPFRTDNWKIETEGKN